ncbi:putative Fic family protein [Alcanivorax sp. 521-1]|uniref:Protein adenylyltransferase n=1 Tax=Alloalcanivorax profundimaris TaxID=2735259 RepID=A0ABS0ATZ6_9GAMM|nr:Fic family protein [Alloalcanivorax profundimaris]MBF5057619.1 putative Fic family protein [Alloalcanivorax profundimaris]
MSETGRAGRAGRYLQQPTGYRAFIPEPLPPEPPINLAGELQHWLSQADRALGRLDGSIQTLPHPDLFVAMYVRKEAVLSSQIEGTQSSLQDLLAAEASIFAPDRPKDVDEVVNYVRAMKYGLHRLEDLPVSVRLIREIHAELMQGVRGQHLTPGEPRTSQNWIGPGGCTLAEATFVPPPPHEVARLLGDLELFLHDEAPLPLLIKIGLAHAQFETIHPFLDGNGRVGRLLITFLLCEKEVLLKPVLYLSHYFKQHRQEYYDCLQAVRDEGDWERWLLFFLRGLYDVSQQATETARQILLLRERHRELITDKLGRAAGNGHRLLEQLYTTPILSVTEVQDLIGTTYPAANNLMRQFAKYGLVREMTGQRRHRRFVYQDYISLFHDGTTSEDSSG